VPGRLLNQFSLSEHDGYLRVATTTDPGAGCCRPVTPAPGGTGAPAQSESAVTVLAQRGDRLVEVGRVGGLGKGERIYAVRFLGPLGYVVTFRETDPLYTVDLSDPRRPRAAGELKINGYSAYLHPAGEGRLIGVGQDATADGRRTGTQVSLFDVADPAQPRRIARYQVPYGQSEAEFDHHAFLYWPATGLLVLPVTRPWTGADPVPDGGRGATPPELRAEQPGTGALVLRVSGDRLAPVGTVVHPVDGRTGQAPFDPFGNRPGVRRAVVAGNTLWTVSADGALASDEGSLRRRAWVGFGG
jgi:hypothetical protein